MKSKKLLTILVGIAISVSIIFCGIIVVTGIQKGSAVSAPSSQPEEIHSYKLEKTSLEEFSEISISASYADISILPSDGYYLEYCLDGTCTEPFYRVSDGKFQFQEGSTQEKYMISFGFSSHEPFFLKLYVPTDKYFDMLSIVSDSGNIYFKEISAKQAELTLDYGNLDFERFTGDTLRLTMDSGNVEFGTISCEDVTLESSYGNVTGDTFTASNGIFSIDSGNLSLMDADFKNLDIACEYGDVDLELRQTVSDYNCALATDYGNIYVNNEKIKPNDDDEVIYKKDNKKNRKMKIFCDSGNITVSEK